MGRTMGMYNSSLSMGTMLGPVIGGALLDFQGVRTVFISGAVLGILGWAALMVMFPAKKDPELRIEHSQLEIETR